MLRNAKDLDDYALRARDGDIGKVWDFYFDDQLCHIRYFVVDTGHWLAGRRVLISPETVKPCRTIHGQHPSSPVHYTWVITAFRCLGVSLHQLSNRAAWQNTNTIGSLEGRGIAAGLVVQRTAEVIDAGLVMLPHPRSKSLEQCREHVRSFFEQDRNELHGMRSRCDLREREPHRVAQSLRGVLPAV